MRNFRLLPPLWRLVSLLGLLFPLAALALLVPMVVTNLRAFPQVLPDMERVGVGREVVLALNFGLLGMACTFSVYTYRTRLRRPDREPLPPGLWWRSKVRATLRVVALMVLALALALVATLLPLPLTLMLVLLACSAVCMLAAAVLLIAWAIAGAKVRD